VLVKPQKENGYTPIANELLEAIYSTSFNATQLKILLFIMRYTYGFSRKEHAISLNFISNGTRISRRYVSSELNVLISAKIIIIAKEHTDTEARVLMLNKNYMEWDIRGRNGQQVNNSSTGEPEQDTTGEPEQDTTGEELFYQDKQNIKQNIKQSDVDQFFESIWQLYPNKKGKGQIKPKKKKELHAVGYNSLKKCIDRYKASKEDWQHWQHGSTFFNSGYVDYLDENYGEIKAKGEVRKLSPGQREDEDDSEYIARTRQEKIAKMEAG
jgi:phage replication O-like protein O